jgi:alpha-beta hydrolase superfamily lysophospholipase
LQESMSDPCVRRYLTAREVLRVKNVVCGTARVAKRLDPRIPILVLQGTVDHVLRPASASRIMHAARTSDKALVMIPGCGHVMLGTNHLKPLVVSSINQWLNREDTVALAGATLSSAQ